MSEAHLLHEQSIQAQFDCIIAQIHLQTEEDLALHTSVKVT